MEGKSENTGQKRDKQRDIKVRNTQKQKQVDRKKKRGHMYKWKDRYRGRRKRDKYTDGKIDRKEEEIGIESKK